MWKLQSSHVKKRVGWICPKGRGRGNQKLAHRSNLELCVTAKWALICHLFSHTLARPGIQIMYQHKTQQYKLLHQTEVYSQHRDLSVFNKLRNGAIASRGAGRGKACFGGALRGAEQIEQHPGPHKQGVPREGGRPHGLSQATRTPGGAQHCVHRSPAMSPPYSSTPQAFRTC